MGPNPAINAYVQSHGAVRIVAGAASGGAFLVVRPGITTPSDLKGKVLATPQLGNTQDVALRTWLRLTGCTRRRPAAATSRSVRGQRHDRPGVRSSTRIDGAWLPEPYASELVAAGGHGPRRRAHALARRSLRDDRARRAHRLPPRAPGDRSGALLQGQQHAHRRHPQRPGARRAARRAGHPERDGSVGEGEHHRRRLPVDHLHQRPARLVRAHPGPRRPAARPASRRPT